MTKQEVHEVGIGAFYAISRAILGQEHDAPLEDLICALAWSFAHAIVFGETQAFAPEHWTRDKFAEHLAASLSELRASGVGRGEMQ